MTFIGKTAAKFVLRLLVVFVAFIYMVNVAGFQKATGPEFSYAHPAEYLTDGMECWGYSEVAKASIPGHVIFRYVKGGEWRVGGVKETTLALNNDESIESYKFCV